MKNEYLPVATVSSAETPSKWMTTAEAAAYLRTKPRTLLKWVREGSIKAWPLHGTARRTWRFRKEDLDTALGFVPARTADSVLSSKPSSVALQ
jgi:excisionase family DNA binding protein